MANSDKPYSPPSADVGGGSAGDSDDRFPPDGDLDKAVSGEVRLQAMEAMKEGWARTYGIKLTTNIAFTLLLPVYYGAFLVAFKLAGIDFSNVGDPLLAWFLSLTKLEANPNPIFRVSVRFGFAPLIALTYLSIWNVGIRRAAGHSITIGDAFPFHKLVQGTLVMFMLAPLGLLWFIHPFAIYLGWPFWMALMWTLPMFLDREIGIGDAVQKSAKITVNNIVAMLGIGLMLFAGYLASVLTCGIGLIWLMPFTCATLGAAWRQLAGLDLAKAA